MLKRLHGIIKNKKASLFDLSFIGLIFLSVFNLIDCIGDKSPFIDYILFVLPYIILAVASEISRRKKWEDFNGWLALAISVIMFTTTGPNEYSGMAFLVFAIHIIKSSKIRIAIFTGQTVLIILMNTFKGHDLNNLLTQFFIYGFAFAIYFILFRREEPEVIIPELDATDKKILTMIAAGQNHKAIGYEIGITGNAVSHRIKRIRDDLGFITNEQLVFNLTKRGFMRDKGDS